jgi:hypothetical protein
MFDANELASLDSNYFTVIYKDIYDVTIKSNNTGHYWSLHSPAIRSGNSYHLSFAFCFLPLPPAWKGDQSATGGKKY